MVAATEVVPLSAPSPVPSDAKTAVVVNGAEKPGTTTTATITTAAAATTTTTTPAVKSKPKGKNQQRREKRKQKKIQSSRESSVVTECESESVRVHGQRQRHTQDVCSPANARPFAWIGNRSSLFECAAFTCPGEHS